MRFLKVVEHIPISEESIGLKSTKITIYSGEDWRAMLRTRAGSKMFNFTRSLTVTGSRCSVSVCAIYTIHGSE